MSSPNEPIGRVAGTIADGQNNQDDALRWDDSVGAGVIPRSYGIVTVTTDVDMVLHVREAANLEELETPFGGLHHEFLQDITAGQTKRVIVGQDGSLGAGMAWLVNESGGSGTYSITGSRRFE